MLKVAHFANLIDKGKCSGVWILGVKKIFKDIVYHVHLSFPFHIFLTKPFV